MLAPRKANFCAEDDKSRSTAWCRGLKPVCFGKDSANKVLVRFVVPSADEAKNGVRVYIYTGIYIYIYIISMSPFCTSLACL